MAKGLPSAEASNELRRLRQAILAGKPQEMRDISIYNHALDLLTSVNDNRNERLDKADGTVPLVLWLVLIAGGPDYPRLSGLFRHVESSLPRF